MAANTDTSRRMVEAAASLIARLTLDQREQASWGFPANDERLLWFYTPTDHGGLSLTDMDSIQHRDLYRLLAVALSERGYNTMSAVIGLENTLDRVERFTVDFGRPRGRDPLLYWFAVFGEPSLQGAWSWRFGGHHVSLHYTMIDGVIVSTTPSFLGADPAVAPLLGPHLHRPLGGIEDLGRELVQSLDEGQAVKAVAAPTPPLDIVGANRTALTEGDGALSLPLIWRNRLEQELEKGFLAAEQRMTEELGIEEDHVAAVAFSRRPKGISAADLSAPQQEVLRELLGTYVGRVSDDLADRELAKFAGSRLDQLHFLWAGSMASGDPHYFRIQGNELFAEYDNAQRGGNHVHTVWRDLSADFGGDPLAQHYVTGHNN